MNWSKAILAGVVGGLVLTTVDFLMHGVVMAETYAKYPVFTQEAAGTHYFFLIGICYSIMVALLFSRTRSVWAEGLGGGLTFGCFLGLVAFFVPFYNSLVLEGYPYYLSWCQGGMNFIGSVVLGCVLGLLIKQA